ncbi:MAG: DNA-binding protein [Aliishimia sp.]
MAYFHDNYMADTGRVVAWGNGITGAYHYQDGSRNMAKNNTSLEKKVREAFHKLTNDRQEVTNEAVRKAIGGGSFRDVAPLVKAAKAELAAKEQAVRAAPEMPEDFHDAAAAMWHMSWQLADEIAASERRAHSAEIEKLKAEADEALSNCALVKDERDDAETPALALSKQLEDKLGTLIALLRTEIDNGIETVWIADEYNVHGGHEQRILDHSRLPSGISST